MTNVELIAAHVAKHGGKNILIHPIPDSPLWLVMEKVGSDRWIPTLLNPMHQGRHHQFGAVSNAEHLRFLTELVLKEIDHRAKTIARNAPMALGAARDPPS